MLDTNYTNMMNDVSKTIISYILYLNNNTTIYNYRYTQDIFKKNVVFKITSYMQFLRTKPDICKTYIYIDEINNHTFIKTSGLLGDMLLDILIYKQKIVEVNNTLKWLLSKNKDILYFSYKKRDYKYFRLPYVIK